MPYQEIIRQYLIDNKSSQEELANTLGVNQTTVSQWLSGKKKPGYDSIKLIYDKLGVTPNVLFGIDEYPPAQILRRGF